jgi:heat shock protein HtpX
MNRVKTFVLLSVLTALLVAGGQMLAGRAGVMVALTLAVVMNFGAYWFSDRFVLRMYDARPLSFGESPWLFRTVQVLAKRAGVPMPQLYVVPEGAPNAFATGRDPEHGVIAVTEGLLRVLNKEEVEGVLAHEMAHIKHRDTLLMTVAATLAGAISSLANFAMWGALLGGHSRDEEDSPNPITAMLAMLFAPIAASLVQLAISRTREYAADQAAAEWTANPLGLASALQRIEAAATQLPFYSGSPETAHLFIQNPFSGGGLGALFRTHPTTKDRVQRLWAMARRQRIAA